MYALRSIAKKWMKIGMITLFEAENNLVFPDVSQLTQYANFSVWVYNLEWCKLRDHLPSASDCHWVEMSDSRKRTKYIHIHGLYVYTPERGCRHRFEKFCFTWHGMKLRFLTRSLVKPEISTLMKQSICESRKSYAQFRQSRISPTAVSSPRSIRRPDRAGLMYKLIRNRSQ